MNRYAVWKKQLDRLLFSTFGIPDAEALPDRNWEGEFAIGHSPAEAIENVLNIDIENPNIDNILNELF